jgi:hypothetical protein
MCKFVHQKKPIMNKFKISHIVIYMFAGSVMFYGCGNESGQNSAEVETEITQEDQEQKNENIFYALPSPLQLGKILQRAGAGFEKNLLNPVGNASGYATKSARALNLGVYGADLSYSAIFDQSQEIINYLNASKKLADELGASSIYSGDVVGRIENNSGRRDSILPLLGEILLNSSEVFKENEQEQTAALVAAGGFIEGLYIGTQVAKNAKDKAPIIQRIAELKGSLDNMIGLLEQNNNIVEVAIVIADLKAIKAVYDEVSADAIATKVSIDENNKVATIGGGSSYILSDAQFVKITELAFALRGKITKI